MRKLIVISMFIIVGCGSSNNESMFRGNVINPIPNSIKNINMAKDRSAIHGALFFDFESSGKDLNLIIQKNNLNQKKEIPNIIESIASNSPWVNEIKSKNIKIYGKILEEKYEWHALYLFVAEKKIYCVKN